MKRIGILLMVICFVLLVADLVSAQVRQSMVNSPGGVQSTGSPVLPVADPIAGKCLRYTIRDNAFYWGRCDVAYKNRSIHTDGRGNIVVDPGAIDAHGNLIIPADKYMRAHAQNPNPPLKQFSDPKPDIVAAPASAQTEIQSALQAEADAVQARDAAQARLDAAQANTRATLYKAMSESGIKPSECSDGQNAFACIRRDPKTGFGFERKKAVAEAKPDKPKGSQ